MVGQTTVQSWWPFENFKHRIVQIVSCEMFMACFRCQFCTVFAFLFPPMGHGQIAWDIYKITCDKCRKAMTFSCSSPSSIFTKEHLHINNMDASNPDKNYRYSNPLQIFQFCANWTFVLPSIFSIPLRIAFFRCHVTLEKTYCSCPKRADSYESWKDARREDKENRERRNNCRSHRRYNMHQELTKTWKRSCFPLGLLLDACRITAAMTGKKLFLGQLFFNARFEDYCCSRSTQIWTWSTTDTIPKIFI